MSYNLKAKNKKTGEILEFSALDNYYGHHKYGYSHQTFHDKGNIGILTEDEFNTLYEVIDDTPIEKGWREDIVKDTCQRLGINMNVDVRADIVNEVIQFVEQQAYARGQEEAYRKSAEVARSNTINLEDITSTALEVTFAKTLAKGRNHACEEIALEIEQLASNKE